MNDEYKVPPTGVRPIAMANRIARNCAVGAVRRMSA